MTRHLDIVIVADGRLPGGSSAALAEEIAIQARAGHRTALLQFDSTLLSDRHPLAPRLRACVHRGELELALGTTPIEADLLLVRGPRVAAELDATRLPDVVATQRLLVADEAPLRPGLVTDEASVEPADDVATQTPDGASVEAADDVATQTPEEAGTEPPDHPGEERRYRPSEVTARLEGWLGATVQWAPTDPRIRAALLAEAPGTAVASTDWTDVIDAPAWRLPRVPGRHRVPVIGRHGGNDPLDWPGSREELLRIYPDGDHVEVHLLGGEEPLAGLLLDREVPHNWVVHPFGSVPVPRFLGGLDLFVHHPHPAWLEAPIRSVLEALAAGVPALVPPGFEALLGPAATYATPAQLPATIADLAGDPVRYRDAVERGTTLIAERFGPDVHRERVAALAAASAAPGRTAGSGATSGHEAAGGHPDPSAAEGIHEELGAPLGPVSGSRGRVLFVSSNGAGVGHLMRLMALARFAPDDIEPLFLTFSQGAAVVDDAGYLVEYLASRSVSGAPARAWHRMLRERTNELIERYDVRALVFDGTNPYQGLLDAAVDQPQVGLVWSRRAMWQEGVSNPVLDHEADRFDLVIEPGELAAEEDRGATVAHRDRAVRVDPVTFLGRDDLLDRAAARAELDLDPDRPAALVNLGAGNINDVSSLLGMVVDRLAAEPELQVCVTRSIIAEQGAQLPENVRPISVYPLARYLHAFDLAFAASGYNSFHELLLAAVPTAFVPNVQTALDDQAARARFAGRTGIGLDLRDPTPEAIDRAVASLVDPQKRRRMHERAVARAAGNGAEAAMAAITRLVADGPGPRLGPGAAREVFARRRTTPDDPPPPAPGPVATALQQLTGDAPGSPDAEPPSVTGSTPLPATDRAPHDATTTDAPADITAAHAPAADTAAADAAAAPTDESAPTHAVEADPSATDTPAEPAATGTSPTGAPLEDGGAVTDAPVLAPTPAVEAAGTGARGTPARVRRILVAPLGWARSLLRRVRRLRAGLALATNRERVRALVRVPYGKLPVGMQRRVRSLLRGWEPPAARSTGAEPVAALPLPLGQLRPLEAATPPARVMLVLPSEIDASDLELVVERTQQLQAALQTFVPLFVTSTIDFRPLRASGYLFEYLPPRSAYARLRARDGWAQARQRRLATIASDFAITSVVALPSSDDREELLAALAGALGGVTRTG